MKQLDSFIFLYNFDIILFIRRRSIIDVFAAQAYIYDRTPSFFLLVKNNIFSRTILHIRLSLKKVHIALTLRTIMYSIDNNRVYPFKFLSFYLFNLVTLSTIKSAHLKSSSNDGYFSNIISDGFGSTILSIIKPALVNLST